MWSNLFHIVNVALIAQSILALNKPLIKGNKETNCPPATHFGNGPPTEPCTHPTDPNNLPPSPLEQWFTKSLFNDLFPKSNIGWGPNPCSPYSYESFVIAARYFPKFGVESPKNNYSEIANTRRDVAAFFAHAVQETGENSADLYATMNKQDADNCFYRGGFFNWFEGGPTSAFLPNGQGHSPADGATCNNNGRYCTSSAEIDYWYPCSSESGSSGQFHGCYFGRGALQISYNYNYGQFQAWLQSRQINVDLLSNPNLVITKMDPPLAMLASLWFYMTPQPPKPAMHDIVLGMPVKLDGLLYNLSWQPDWSTTWQAQPCNCAPASYGGIVPYFDPKYYPDAFVAMNEANRQRCVKSIYDNPSMYSMNSQSSPCLNFPPK
uniref:Glycoside hydrolase family 19 catalytic domain-containing protein n=1 Tax=Plectus sambesii TaxID=2011161 RepID=A0A914X038_9BILA